MYQVSFKLEKVKCHMVTSLMSVVIARRACRFDHVFFVVATRRPIFLNKQLRKIEYRVAYFGGKIEILETRKKRFSKVLLWKGQFDNFSGF